MHLYARGGSQRGPSLRLHFADVVALESAYLLHQCLHVNDGSTDINDNSSDSGYASSLHSKADRVPYEIYIPAPAGLSKERAYTYHVVTRNCFAYAAGLPVVGDTLGDALTQLWDRLTEWQLTTVSWDKLMGYCEEQGYLDFAEQPGHALASLVLAEHVQQKDLWIDAFSHAVGMQERLDLSPEMEGISMTTGALIIRASLEMDLHLTRVVRALGSFLEDEMGTENLGLTKPARDHLDRFRSFLHNYYVDKLGYYPPQDDGPWNKQLWTRMYKAFQALYEYLVDKESSNDPTSLRGLNGGICVAQNVQAFNERHGYTPLPHPLPLVPETTARRRTIDAQKPLRNLRISRSDSVTELKPDARQAIERATNVDNHDILECVLVQEYQRFERQKLEEKLSIGEARKVRWLLIYGVLQMLISMTRAPQEVRDADTPSYPMCVLTVGCPPWSQSSRSKTQTVEPDVEAPLDAPKSEEAADTISIHPDCEAETAEDYFAAQSISRNNSEKNLEGMAFPLRVTTQLSRTASIRSSVQYLHKSVVGSLAKRHSGRRLSSFHPDASREKIGSFSSLSEVLSEKTQAEEEVDGKNPIQTSSPISINSPWTTEPTSDFDFGLGASTDEPILDDAHLAVLTDLPPIFTQDLTQSPTGTAPSSATSEKTTSNRSSTCLQDYDSPATELSSSWDAASFKHRNSTTSIPASPTTTEETKRSHRKKPSRRANLGFTTSCVSVAAGCYTPTKPSSSVPERSYPQKKQAADEKAERPMTPVSTGSSAISSVYAEKASQAAEIEEQEMRGRRRLRGLDRLSDADLRGEGRRVLRVVNP